MDTEEQCSPDLGPLSDMPVQMSVVLGRCRMKLGDILKIAPGEVVELDRTVNDLVEVFINDKVIARGQIVVVEDRIGVALKEIVTKG